MEEGRLEVTMVKNSSFVSVIFHLPAYFFFLNIKI